MGLTHYCGKTRSGKFVVKRKTQVKRLVRKLKEIREEMRQRMYAPVREQHRWLCQVLRESLSVLWRHLQLSVSSCVPDLRRQALAQDTRKAKPKGSRYLGVLQQAPDPSRSPNRYPSGLAQMIAPPPVLPEKPAAVTPRGGIRTR